MFLEILKIVLPFALAVIVHYLTLRYEEKKYERTILRERVDKGYSKFYVAYSFGMVSLAANSKEIMTDTEFLQNFSPLGKFLVDNILYFETETQQRIVEFHNFYTIVECALKANQPISVEVPILRKKAIQICDNVLLEYKRLSNKLKMPEPNINSI